MCKKPMVEAKAREVEQGAAQGAGIDVWRGLREIQRGTRGLQPVKSRFVKKPDGQVSTSPVLA